VNKVRKKIALMIIIGIVLAGAAAGLIISRKTKPSPTILDAALGSRARFEKLSKILPYLIIIDYSRPVYAKRLWVLEAATGKVILTAHVAHAWNSGFLYAKRFSNTPGSKRSCLGAFLTGKSFQSRFGKAMRIKGLEKEFNDKAEERGIWFHASYFPWTWGCFGTLPSVNRKIIALTENNSFLYVRGRHD